MRATFCLLLAFAAATAVFGDKLSDCSCQEGYQAKEGLDGEVQCVGIHLFHIMPCNMPKRPNCACGEGVTGILNDKSGTWCSTYADGKEVKRWPCENAKDWEDFYNKYPGEKPK